MKHIRKFFLDLDLASPFLLILLILASSSPVRALDWTQVSPNPPGSYHTAVTYGNGVFILVGANGSISRSTDGVNWEGCDSTVNKDLNDVIWDGSRFIAVGEALVTLDGGATGETWTKIYQHPTSTAPTFYSVAYDGATYVTGSSNSVYTSADAISWTQNIAAFTSLVTYHVFYGMHHNGTQFMGVGSNGIIFTSTTPAGSWLEQSSGVTEILKSVSWSSALSRYVVAGYNNTLLTSSDGAAWAVEDSGYTESSDNFTSIIWDGSQYVLAGLLYGSINSTILSSPDGFSWSQHTVPTRVAFSEVAYGGGVYVAGGSNGVLFASDGLDTMVSVRQGPVKHLDEVVWGGGRFAAVGDMGTFISSPDGVTWNEHVIPNNMFIGNLPQNLNAVAANDTLTVVAGNLGTLITSPDLINWTRRSHDYPGGMRDIIWDGAQFVMVGDSSATTGGLILTSPDGINWTPRYTDSDDGSMMAAVAYSGGRYMAVGDNISVVSSQFAVTSTDGINWARTTTSPGARIKDIIWDGANSRFIAAAYGDYIAATTDGTSWTPVDSGIVNVGLYGLAADSSRYIAVGSDILGSPDSVNWVVETSPSIALPILYGVATDSNRFTAVGNDGTVITSDLATSFDADGLSPLEGDCNDNDSTIYPGATEIYCDGIDQNCNGMDDDDPDNDSDGYGFCSDCNDSNSAINPGAAEVCNEVDDDCDTLIDEGLLSIFYADADSDGYGDSLVMEQACTASTGYVADASDCDDTDGAINPGAAEVCNEADDDCDGDTDEGVTNIYYLDTDSDGYGDSAFTEQACAASTGYVADASDCDDTDSAVNPGATEVCNEVDDDCDALIDEDLDCTPAATGGGGGGGCFIKALPR